MVSANVLMRLVALVVALCASAAFAAGGHAVALERAPVDLGDKASLQNGAKIFVNNCLNCHQAAYMRYARLTDIGLTEQQIKDNFLFDKNAKTGDTMTTALAVKDAKEWFGAPPPDLTLVARVRGADWLYGYMRGFYRDDKTASGWNNRVFPNVAMPHVLSDVQGMQRAVYVEKESHGVKEKVLERLELAVPGKLSPLEYDRYVADLVNYLVYMGEPAKRYRSNLGVLVLMFLGVMFLLALWLKHEYWKDVK